VPSYKSAFKVCFLQAFGGYVSKACLVSGFTVVLELDLNISKLYSLIISVGLVPRFGATVQVMGLFLDNGELSVRIDDCLRCLQGSGILFIDRSENEVACNWRGGRLLNRVLLLFILLFALRLLPLEFLLHLLGVMASTGDAVPFSFTCKFHL